MRFLLVTPYYYPATSYGGPIYSVKALAENLASRGYDVTVLTSNLNRDKEIYNNTKTEKKINNVKIIYFRVDYFKFLKKNLFGYFYSSALKKYLKKNIRKFNIVHSQINFNYFSYISLKLAQKNNITNFFSQRGTYSPERLKFKFLKKKLYFLLVEKHLIKQCSNLIALNDFEIKYYKALGFINKIVKIPNGIDKIKFKRNTIISSRIKKDKINILYLARISKLKGIDILIKTIIKYNNKLKNYNFHIAGYDEDKYFETFNHNLLKQNNIFYHGHLDSDLKYSLVEKIDALILPSYGEGLSISILEALYFQKIILTSNLIKFSDKDFEINFNLNPSSIFKALKKYGKLKKNNKLKIESLNAKKYVMENFSWSVIVDKYLKLSKDSIFR
jgi:glycosyltransferase involved in cell wall biosynthesis